VHYYLLVFFECTLDYFLHQSHKFLWSFRDPLIDNRIVISLYAFFLALFELVGNLQFLHLPFLHHRDQGLDLVVSGQSVDIFGEVSVPRAGHGVFLFLPRGKSDREFSGVVPSEVDEVYADGVGVRVAFFLHCEDILYIIAKKELI